jgi:hypothetical protein
MTKRLTPYIAIGIMLLILFFIFGVRYGQRVEKTNKTISYLISQFPTKKPEPTIKPLEFSTYQLQGCGIQFLYPDSLEKQKETSVSAEFSERKEKVLVIDCDQRSPLAQIIKDDAVASEEIKLNNKPIRAKLNRVKSGDLYVFQMKNLSGKSIYISILKSLYPLFEKSFEFVQK